MLVEGLVKSRSNRPTLLFFASTSARVVAMRLLPTPPLPPETAMMLCTCFSLSSMMLMRGSTMAISLLLWSQARFPVLPVSQSLGCRIWDI